MIFFGSIYPGDIVFGVYNRHQNSNVYDIYYEIYNINMRDIMTFDLEFQGQNGQGHNIDIIYSLNFSDIDFSTYRHQNTSFYDIYYQIYNIKCVTSCLTLNFKVRRSRSQYWHIYVFEFSDTDFSTYRHQTQVSTIYLHYQR